IAFQAPESRDAAHLWVTTQQCAVTTGSLDGWPGRCCSHSPGPSAVIGRDLATGPGWAPDGEQRRAPPPAGLEAASPCHVAGPEAVAGVAGNEVGITGARKCAPPLCSAHLCAALSAETWT